MSYRSHYNKRVVVKDGVTEEKHFAVWNMWFGKVFNHEDFIVA